MAQTRYGGKSYQFWTEQAVRWQAVYPLGRPTHSGKQTKQDKTEEVTNGSD